MKKLSKRALARIITFLTAGVLAVSLFTAGAVVKAKEYERKTEAMYQRSLAQAGECLSDIDTVLLKGLYSNSPAAQSSMCADLWRDAYEAKNAISSLPIADIDMEKCYTFLSKIAEYARATEKKIAAGETIDDAAHATFLSIQNKTATLAKNVEKLQNIYLSTNEKIAGGIDFSFAVPRTIATSSATSDGLNAMNKNLSEAPKLIFDGPYSDAINEKSPRMLQNQENITLKQATQTAEELFKNISGTLRYTGKKDGNVPCFMFQKGDAYAEISVAGGKTVSFNVNKSASKTAFDTAYCLNAAKKYVEKSGYKNMKCDYYELSNHIFIANFHAVQDGVNCYTDLIKVKLNCENGNVCGFDALSYLTHHTQRTFNFALSQKQAQSAVSKYLKIKTVKKALIPTAAEQEVPCYEFRCISAEGNELLVYINAATGKEQDILILQIGENGVLTK